MPMFISFVGVILFILPMCYCIENNPQNAIVGFPPFSSASSSSSSSSSSAKVEPGVSENEDDRNGNSKERHFVGLQTGGRPKDLNRISEGSIRHKRSASMDGRLQRYLDSVEVPDVLYDRQSSRLLHPGDLKYIYDSGYETALDNPNGQAVVGSANDDGLFGWRNPGGIGDEGSSSMRKTYKELSLFNELGNPEPAHQIERKRKWKSKNMAMWG